MVKRILMVLAAAATAAVFGGMTGCATKNYVDKQVEWLYERHQGLESSVTSSQDEDDEVIVYLEGELKKVQAKTENNTEEIDRLKEIAAAQKLQVEKGLDLAQEALKRAERTNSLSDGKLLYEVTISDETIPFAYKKSALSEEARTALDTFAEMLIAENKKVFIEIQGHTDNVGSDAYNLALGRDRAESVKRYLHTEHNIPLDRMGVFSYGESQPAAGNDTPEGRAQNRRVLLVVMQ